MRARSTVLEDDVLSRLRAAEAELQALRAEVEHQHRLAMIGTLAAGAVHEINNLLTPVLAYAQLAHAQPDDSELATKSVEQTLRGVAAATQVAEVLLGFSATEDRCTTANLSEVVHNAVRCLGRDPSRDGISLSIDVPVVDVAISPLSLQQVVLNLLINAVQALRNRPSARISIIGVHDSDQVTIRVVDNGPGLNPNTRLFEPFSVSRETGGHGLGLWVCKHLIEDANGSISVSSGDAGTSFTMTLPAA